MTDKSEEEHPYLYPTGDWGYLSTWPKPYLYPPYPIKGMSEVTDCELINTHSFRACILFLVTTIVRSVNQGFAHKNFKNIWKELINE